MLVVCFLNIIIIIIVKREISSMGLYKKCKIFNCYCQPELKTRVTQL